MLAKRGENEERKIGRFPNAPKGAIENGDGQISSSSSLCQEAHIPPFFFSKGE